MTGHDKIWSFPLPDGDNNKGKKPDRGHPFVPNYQHPLHKQEDRFSVPRPPPGKGCPHPMPQPIGHAPENAAYLRIKPILMQPPKPFKGAHNNIEHFIGDCITYFEAFATYFLLNSQTVPFAASYFEEPAKEWWVYKRPEFWANDNDDPVSARFRYPTWPEFVAMLTAQFCDPAIEIVHECKMFEVHMGKNPASQFFYELEKEAKGLPKSYTTTITNIGRDVPQTYSEWKARILIMYDEQQKNYAFNQHLNHRDNRQPYKGTNTTATSNTKAGGVTSSLSGKPTSSAAPSGGQRDAGGRWLACPGTTFGGAGVPMDIGQMHAQGLCFRCHKKGHLSKDCPEKKDFQDIRVQGRGGKGGGKSSSGLGFDSPMITKDLHTATSCSHMHSAIPTSNLTAFNVSRTTSTPVLESQNRYAALSVEEYDNDNDTDTDMPLKGSNDGSPARAEAKVVKPAGHEAESLSTLRNRGANRYASSLHGETQPAKASGEKSPTIVTPIDTASQPCRMDGTWDKLKYTPCEASLQDEQAAPTQGSPITTASIEPRLDGAMEDTTRKLTTTPMSARAVTRPRMGIKRQPSTDSEGTGQTGEDNPGIPPLNEQGRSSEGIPPRRALAVGQEAASAQAVKRRHSVTVVEVPDKENDTAYQIWLAKERLPAVAKQEATSGKPTQPSTKGNEHSSVPLTKPDPSRWLKPFEVDWTLCAVCKARNNNAAHAALFVWMHRDRTPKLTPELLDQIHQGGETA
ncbi:uncharacterized protein ARMOST_03210 [Armillaria ostoyae]|uniref:CCHC-type domain-containing protein n=1 Tax=Armillaria ostoyae TaxID=47428 RepID=A0A284QTX6_ARMOS|nr:uncharacterized protein ARMOST_03210 [Armillaria ostoyae]